MTAQTSHHDWPALGLEERQPGVLISTNDIVSYGGSAVDALKSYAQSLPQRRARILLHGHESNALHEMLIVAPELTIWPPLLNERPPQSWHLIEGDLAFIKYAPPGEILDITLLSARSHTAPSFLRYSGTGWYTTVPLSAQTVYLETKPGPHKETKFADWGPQSSSDPLALPLIQKLKALREAEN